MVFRLRYQTYQTSDVLPDVSVCGGWGMGVIFGDIGYIEVGHVYS
jgi:hypothetical protein